MTYINPRAKVFQHLDRLAEWRTGEMKPAPVTVEWDLSNRCYLGCQSCHFAYTHSRGPWTSRMLITPHGYDGTGDLASTALVEDVLLEMATSRMGSPLSIVWSGGGEPTMHPDWQRIVSFARSMHFEQGMYTAGGMLTKESAALLATCSTWVVVSLDAADATTYAREKRTSEAKFDAACNGVRYLAAAKECEVGVSFLLHSGNWHRAFDMLGLARDLGATYATFRPTIETEPHAPGFVSGNRSWINEASATLLALSGEPDVEIDPARFYQYRDWIKHPYSTCYGIRLATAITPDGRVWVCTNRRGYTGSCLGDLREESFADIWHRHPGKWTDFEECRVMCRLYAVNETLAAVEAPRPHGAFV